MKLFDVLPENFFSLLAATKRELYVDALLIVQSAFKSDLVIKKTDLLAMLAGSLESSILEADFTEEENENIESIDNRNEVRGLSGKSRLLLKKIQDCGWVKIEFEGNSFEEIVTIPDYAIPVLNVLQELTQEKVQEYNGYVYTTYAALKNAGDNSDYAFEALSVANKNAVDLVDALKLLFNNIQRFHKKIADDLGVNAMLEEYFDKYKKQIMDLILYPLKTMDSVPRFKNPILEILYAWQNDENIIEQITEQGIRRRAFTNKEEGREQVQEMLNSVTEIFETVEVMLDKIDERHREYTSASIDRIRYMLNSDRSIKGKLVAILQHSQEQEIYQAMQQAVVVYEHRFMDMQSLYSKAKRSARTEGKPLALTERNEATDAQVMERFLQDVKKQYDTKKIDAYIAEILGEHNAVATDEIDMHNTEEFILFMLATLRAREKTSRVEIEFLEGNTLRQGYSLPRVVFRRKHNGA